ncbi:hypothetical protein ACWGEU_29915 [Streptomyces goshikiensis]
MDSTRMTTTEAITAAEVYPMAEPMAVPATAHPGARRSDATTTRGAPG